MSARRAQEEVDCRSALAVLEGDELGREPMLGLFRRALEEYDQVCAVRLHLHWELKDCPWLVLIPNHAELIAPWESGMGAGAVLRRVQEHEVQLCTAAAGALYLHARTRRDVSYGMRVLKRVEQAVREARQRACRQCRCGHIGPWVNFPFVGIQQDETTPLELRNCPGCKTTLAIEAPCP